MRLECTHEEGRAVRVDVHIDKDDVSITRRPEGGMDVRMSKKLA